MTKALMNEAGHSVQCVIADGAYDLAKAKHAYPLIPLSCNAKLRKGGEERNKAMLEIRGLGGDIQSTSSGRNCIFTFQKTI